MDGTLLDSSEAIGRCWGNFASRYQLEFDEFIPLIQGKPAHESIAMLRPTASQSDIENDSKWFEMLEASDTQGVVAYPGAIDLLNNLNRQHIPWAIVTSGTLPVATARIRAANLPFPKILVTPENVKRGKPDPEPYVFGARTLGLDINRCIVFEDAPAGIESGNRAGAKTVGILSQFSKSALLEKNADLIINTLLDVSISFDKSENILSVIKNSTKE